VLARLWRVGRSMFDVQIVNWPYHGKLHMRCQALTTLAIDTAYETSLKSIRKTEQIAVKNRSHNPDNLSWRV